MPWIAFDFRPDVNLSYGVHSLLLLGWPGLVIGALIGIWAWRQHRLMAGSLGALVGTGAWVGLHLVAII
jgi:hypothetical protein